MKKMLSILCVFCLCFALCGCSSKNEEDILAFFTAFHNTLDTESGTIRGNIAMNTDGDDSLIEVNLQYRQVDSLQAALTMNLEAGQNRQEDFLCFYIRDGKTYLNSMGTTSQSVLSNLGIDENDKISVYDPFMNFTDSELTALVRSSSKDGSTYTYTLDTSTLSTLFDSMGTVEVEDATLTATIADEIISSFTLEISGTQSLTDNSASFSFTLDCTVSDFNSLENIPFPEDLESY